MFVRVPITTSNKLVEKYTGNIGHRINNSLIEIQKKLNNYDGIPTIPKEKTEILRLKKAPENLIELIRLVYSTKCQTHDHLNNTSHLRDVHGMKLNL